MTTTDLYSGYTADGKPSSRILRPPGGASSNIFGGPEPAAPAPRQQVQQEMAQQSPVAHYQPPAAQNPTADAKNEYQKNKPQGKVQYNPITGEEYPSDYGQQKGENEEEQEKDENDETENDKNESTDSLNDENNTSEEKKPEPVPAPAEQTPPAPFQKVRQPPGGKSSGLW